MGDSRLTVNTGTLDEVDVVVVGSGAAGMTAAILAHDHGARVMIVERTDKVGGTTAVSGGGIWIPLNHRMGELGFSDSRAEALAYLTQLAMGRTDPELLETFVDTAATMIKYLEDHTPLVFGAMTATDYQPELPGGKFGGRSLEPKPFDTNLLGDWRSRLRPPSAFAFPLTREEAFGKYDTFFRPWLVPQDLAAERLMKGVVTIGQALAAGLLKAVLDRNIPIMLETRVRQLLVEGDRVAGVIGEQEGTRQQIVRARAAVILASAGFEWNPRLQAQFLTAPIENPNSPPFNEGDGLLMAMEVGADLGNMAEAWHYPSLMIPGETYEGKPLSRPALAERNGPHVIWVNRDGRRFVNEAANYNSVGRLFHEIRTDGPVFRNLPAWALMDSQYRSQYVLGTTMPEDPDPQWLIKGATLEELAGKVGIDVKQLLATVQEWNDCVRQGADLRFGKGTSSYDRSQGDKQAMHPNLGTIEKAPFYAVPIHTGALGTKGGPRTNCRAQVLHVRGHAIPGLYAAGNVAASITGPGYPGRGATLGPGMTFGYIAGIDAAGEAKRLVEKAAK
ncbi:FAD binding domain protein [Paraburkholderia xenovorans LB400]|uniref:Dehydrogenase flavoprotein n=1 Tax=Paraburkholderia xenovorans (strain LB400) TaxID=266265 RepID=Q13HN0_PARXL|nr:FAD-dependent oxidoreductase [Paraburkholderia xenovorans]ABE36409.1 Putative dehydrogenase flavoprotein [Paraburkholderia xenovorans LB400]AIP35018.1 FAD binding domain protein [Paraburkholderia xenovorans LB400]